MPANGTAIGAVSVTWRNPPVDCPGSGVGKSPGGPPGMLCPDEQSETGAQYLPPDSYRERCARGAEPVEASRSRYKEMVYR